MQISEISQPLDEGIHDPSIFKAIFMAGPPGAGKNTVIAELGLTAAGLKLQDIDRTLAYLNRMRAPEQPDYKRGLDATLRQQSVFQSNMLGLLINTTGRDYESLMGLNKKLKESGYDTFMLFVDVEYDVAFGRIHNRQKYATDPADAGRKVDVDYFEKAYDSSKENLEFYALMFGSQFAVVTNNAELTEAAEDINEYKHTLARAAKKVRDFLRKPLTPKAQEIVKQVASTSPRG